MTNITITPTDVGHLPDALAMLMRSPRYIIVLRNLMRKGSRNAGIVLRDDAHDAYSVDADDLNTLTAYGLFVRYKDLPGTHPMSAVPDNAYSLSPLSIAFLNALHDVMEEAGRRGILSLNFRKGDLENPRFVAARVETYSLYVHEAGLRVATYPVVEPEIVKQMWRKHAG